MKSALHDISFPLHISKALRHNVHQSSIQAMSFSNQQTRAHSNLTNPAYSTTFTSLDRVSSTFDRSILGILNDNDEFNRPLALVTDRPTGQSSVQSMSEDSGAQSECPAYDPSLSSNNTNSQKVFTPQSVSDASGSLHPRIASSRSGGSSDGGYSDCSVANGHSPSLFTHASAGASQAAPSPISSQTPIELPLAGICTPSAMSLALDEPFFGPFDPFERMTDAQPILELNEDDLRFLKERMDADKSSRVGIPAQLSDRMNVLLVQRPRGDSFNLPTRTQRVPRSKAKQRRQQVSSRNAVEKAKATEHSRLIRQIGSCLPCLVNHEQVGVRTSQPLPSSMNTLTMKV